MRFTDTFRIYRCFSEKWTICGISEAIYASLKVGRKLDRKVVLL